MKVNATKLAELYGVDRRTITNWVNSEPPCPSAMQGRERVFDTAAVAQWREGNAARKALAEVERQRPADAEDAKARKLIAEALLAEIEVAEKERSVLPAEVVDEAVGEIGERLRAVIVNVPSNYAIDLEREGVDAAIAQAVLERIAEHLTRALRGVADEIEGEGLDDDPEGDGPAGMDETDAARAA